MDGSKRPHHPPDTAPSSSSTGYCRKSGTWPSGSDDSFFNNAHIEIPVQQPVNSLEKFASKEDFRIKRENNINTPSTSKVKTITSYEIDVNDTLFMDINLENIVQNVDHKICSDTNRNIEMIEDRNNNGHKSLADNFIHNSQQLFLDDVSFKKPLCKNAKFPKQLNDDKAGINDRSFANVSMISIDNGNISGSQYQTRAEIQMEKENSVNNQLYPHQQDLKNLSALSWSESQIFEVDWNEQDDFYGLPNKVKDIMFEHKGINSLYGSYYIFALYIDLIINRIFFLF